ncbi:hypothetical protein I302_106791 [Kwoniella bestiolae CBS 10118]|uniref:DUF6534 domain-containing protein n=1 Tax=Kwoniella bestiolae CBS 10118 TaxID=1296100 RepID=A0AAJ8KBU8_9TREE
MVDVLYNDRLDGLDRYDHLLRITYLCLQFWGVHRFPGDAILHCVSDRWNGDDDCDPVLLYRKVVSFEQQEPFSACISPCVCKRRVDLDHNSDDQGDLGRVVVTSFGGGWSHTDALVKKLLIVTLETQLAPTLMMIAFVIDLSVKPSSTIGIFFDILIPKSYTVGYLATLNTRVHLRRDRSTHGSGNGKAADTNAYHLGTGRLQQATIKIDTETYTESFQIGRPTAGVNRRDMKDVSEEGSVENLDYASNLSKQNLNNPSSQF